MPPPVYQLDPVTIGDDADEREAIQRALAGLGGSEERTAATDEARSILDSAGADEALSGLRVPAPPEAARDPEAERLDRMEAEARELGDRYRASLPSDRPSPFVGHSRGPISISPQPGRRPPTPRPAAPQAPAAPRVQQMEPVDPAVGYAAPTGPRPTSPPSPDPNALMHGTATDAAPVLPGQPGPGARASQSLGDPTLAAQPRPRQAGPEFVDPNGPEFTDPTAGGRARPSAQLADPSPRAEVERLLRARQAQRAAPSPAPAEPEPDFTGADVSDAIRRPLHAIGNALLAAGGRARTPFRSERAQIEARLAQEGEARSERAESEADRAMQRERLDLDRERITQMGADRARQRELEAERNDISRAMQSRRADISGQRAEFAGELARARLAGIRDEREREAAALDPGSEPSQIARLALQTAIAGYPPAARARLAERMGIEEGALDEALSGLNMRAAEQLRASLPSMFRDTTNRRGGGRAGAGGGGAGAAGAGGDTSVDDLVRAAVEIGIPEGVARQMAMDTRGGSRSGRARLQSMVGREYTQRDRASDTRERQTRVHGFSRRPDAPQLSAGEAATVRRVSVADGEFERAVAMLERDLASLTVAERAAGVGNLGSERYRRIEHALEVIRTQLRNINQGGNSVAAQHMAEASVPGLTDRTTVDSILANVRAARAVKHAYVLSLMEAYGYEPDTGSDGHGGGARPSNDDRVSVISPDGQRGSIPRSQLEAARAQGYREAD